MTKYIIRIDYVPDGSEWYLGGTYVFQGGRYPVIGDMSEAKRYSSYKRAESAVESIRNLAGGIKKCEVVEVDG